MTDNIKRLIESSNRDDYILGMEYYCREKGLKYFQDILEPIKRKDTKFHTMIYKEFKLNCTQNIIKLSDGIAIVTFSTESSYIGRWTDYYKMSAGLYNQFWVHEILDI